MDSKKILELVGGEVNINSVSHCMTRLRFVIKDENLIDKEGIENLNIVKGTFSQGGQFQVIIGNNVAEMYKEMVKGTNLKIVSKDEVKHEGAKNMNVFQKIAIFLSEIFAPIIPAIIVGGLILGFRNLMVLDFGFLGGQSLVDLHQFWAGVDQYLWLIGEAIFHFLPVYVCWSAYRKLGGTEVLGLVLGITLVSPQLVNAYAVASGVEIPVWDFGFFDIQMIGYQAQVIPALLVGMFGATLEKGMTKIIPVYIRMIVVPFVVLIVTSLMANIVLGPLGWWLGSLIASVFIWLFSTLGFVGGGIFGLIYAPLVITGLHHTTNAIDLQIIAETGSTPLWPLIALSNIAQASAVVGLLLVKRDSKTKELGIPSAISAYLGVTEPAMFGLNLKFVYAFVSAMIGSSIAGAFAVFMNVEALSIGVGGYPGILSIRPENMFSFFIAMIIATIIPIILTMIMCKRKNNESR